MMTMSTVAPHNGLSELDLNKIQISTRKVFNVRFSLRNFGGNPEAEKQPGKI